jgi:hypothetical protein
MINFFFSCNFFLFLTLINPGSGSVFSLKCWIRIRIKWIRIQNPGREEEGCRCCTWSRVSFFGDSSRMGGWAARLGGSHRLAQLLTGRAQPLHKNTWVKGTVSRDGFGFWWHLWLILGLNRWRGHFKFFYNFKNGSVFYFGLKLKLTIPIIKSQIHLVRQSLERKENFLTKWLKLIKERRAKGNGRKYVHAVWRKRGRCELVDQIRYCTY